MIALMLAALAFKAQAGPVELREASHHRMQYYVSLPQGWVKERTWPILCAIPGAERDFLETANTFVQARKQMPFIIVVPMVTTNGGQRYREAASYKYSESTWDEIVRVGQYTFDLEGIHAAVKDVQTTFSGESRLYLTGFEAGCHTLFAVTFRHPEWLNAAVANSPNFQGRGLEENLYSQSPDRVSLPIHELHGDKDPFSAPDKPFFEQWVTAESAAHQHGFKNTSSQVVPNKGHVWLAEEILKYCSELRRQ